MIKLLIISVVANQKLLKNVFQIFIQKLSVFHNYYLTCRIIYKNNWLYKQKLHII